MKNIDALNNAFKKALHDKLVRIGFDVYRRVTCTGIISEMLLQYNEINEDDLKAAGLGYSYDDLAPGKDLNDARQLARNWEKCHGLFDVVETRRDKNGNPILFTKRGGAKRGSSQQISPANYNNEAAAVMQVMKQQGLVK